MKTKITMDDIVTTLTTLDAMKGMFAFRSLDGVNDDGAQAFDAIIKTHITSIQMLLTIIAKRITNSDDETDDQLTNIFDSLKTHNDKGVS